MWNLDPPPGFQGLREDLPLGTYERHMPHWRQDGATYFVTFRLGDSLPQNRLDELRSLKEEWEKQHPLPRPKQVFQELARIVFERVEQWLDLGAGSCILGEDRFAKIVAESLLYFHGIRYELGCSVIMPNHVHSIIRPLNASRYTLENILGSWKSFTSRRINTLLKQTTNLWQEESYDRIIRNPEHLWKALQYIGRNPAKAKLSSNSCYLWINPRWQELGWTFS